MTPEQINELRELAQKATQGPWSAVSRGPYWNEEEGDVEDAAGRDVSGVEFVKPLADQDVTRGQCWFRDAQYIAAANPQTILALLDELESQQTAHAEACGTINRLAGELTHERATTAYLLNLLADIRTATGDHGKRMQEELVAFLRELKEERDALLEMNLQQATTIRAYQEAAKEQS